MIMSLSLLYKKWALSFNTKKKFTDVVIKMDSYDHECFPRSGVWQKTKRDMSFNYYQVSIVMRCHYYFALVTLSMQVGSLYSRNIVSP